MEFIDPQAKAAIIAALVTSIGSFVTLVGVVIKLLFTQRGSATRHRQRMEELEAQQAAKSIEVLSQMTTALTKLTTGLDTVSGDQRQTNQIATQQVEMTEKVATEIQAVSETLDTAKDLLSDFKTESTVYQERGSIAIETIGKLPEQISEVKLDLQTVLEGVGELKPALVKLDAIETDVKRVFDEIHSVFDEIREIRGMFAAALKSAPPSFVAASDVIVRDSGSIGIAVAPVSVPAPEVPA